MSGPLADRLALLRRHAIDPALALLGPRYGSTEARALMLAIAAQESRLTDRCQRGGGPARSFWQFEQTGVQALFDHRSAGIPLRSACAALLVMPLTPTVWTAIEFNDVLAAACARLLLWAHPDALPEQQAGPEAAWRIYRAQWRPGKPHPETWAALWEQAWLVARDSA